MGAVIAALPPALRALLPDPLPREVPALVRAELARGLTVARLIERADERWNLWGYALAADTAGGGPGLSHPVGVALTLLGPGGCGEPRCDDGTDLDTGAECRTCVREREDRHPGPDADGRPALRLVPGTAARPDGQRALLRPLPDPPAPAPAWGVPEHERAFAVCQGCTARMVPRPGRPPRTHCPLCVPDPKHSTA